VLQFEQASAPGCRSATVLRINACSDPETAYECAVAFQKEIPGTVLLSRDGVGHISRLFKGEAYEGKDDYSIDLKMPRANSDVHSR